MCNLATKIKFWIGIDDGLDIFAEHAVGGIVGNLLTGLFAAYVMITNQKKTYKSKKDTNNKYLVTTLPTSTASAKSPAAGSTKTTSSSATSSPTVLPASPTPLS